jgi:hypothetical protein
VNKLLSVVQYLTLIILVVAGCAAGTDQPQIKDAKYLAAQLAELESMPAPDGVDGELWTELKATLATLVRSRDSRATLAAPVSAASAALLSLDQGTLTLSWDYAAQGDYDQNLEVNAADLSQLGKHFAKNTGGTGPFARGTIEAVVDGDSNGEINITDIGPIGANFGRRVLSYEVLASTDSGDVATTNGGPDGPGAEVRGTVDFVAAVGARFEERLRFSFTLTSAPLAWFYWVRPIDGATRGTPSNVVSFGGQPTNAPPVAGFTATPDSGNAPLLVSLDATASADSDGEIVQFQWDFDGNGSIDAFSSDPALTQVFDTGLFDVRLTVIDNGGATDESAVSVKVAAPGNNGPVALLTVPQPVDDAPQEVLLDASGSSDADGEILTFEWDFDGDGIFDANTGTNSTVQHTYETPGEFNPRVRVTDDDGAAAAEAQDLLVHGIVRVQVPGTDGLGSDIALAEINGAPALSYGQALDMRYTRATTPLGLSPQDWPTPVETEDFGVAGGRITLLEVEGHPALAFSGASISDVRYVRSTTPDGMSTAAWVNQVFLGDCGSSVSMAIVEGNPALAFADDDFNNLPVYMRSNSPTGGTSLADWGPRIPLGTAADSDHNCMLVVVNGVPAVAYHRRGVRDLRYTVSSSPTGGSAADWSPDIQLRANVGESFFTLAEVAGAPAIAYSNNVLRGVFYLRSVTPTGALLADWDNVQTGGIDPGLTDTIFCGMTVANGKPVIGQTVLNNIDVFSAQFMLSSTPDGASAADWQERHSVDAGPHSGIRISMSTVGGFPAMVYHDRDLDAVIYAVRF